MTEFGKKIKIALIEQEKNQNWLIEQVREKTGLFFDSSYLFKIMHGTKNSPKVVCAIREILSI